MGLVDFEIGMQLGEGAVGRVFRAVHRTGTAVALKTVKPTHRLEALSLERELAALARLDHPSILHLYDSGVAGPQDPLAEGTHWMALEYAGGGSLEEWVPQDWPSAEARALEVLSALAHAHARGLVHRDLKPANLVLCTGADLRPGLKVADFGLAWALASDTRGMKRAGSPSYVPPEQLTGRLDDLGPWSDLYAMACVIWEWTCGEPPFGWLDAASAARFHLEQDPGPYRPQIEVPSALEPLLRAMLAKDVRQRPPTAAHVASALQRMRRVRRSSALRAGLLPVPARWRGEQPAPSTAVLTGVGLGLFSLRDPPATGREVEQDVLWEALRRTASSARPHVVGLSGPVGIGRRRLARWLGERALELGCASVIRPEGSLSEHLGLDDPRATLGALQERAGSGPLIVDLTHRPPTGDPIDLAASLLFDGRTPVLLLLAGVRPEPLAPLGDFENFVALALEPMARGRLADFLTERLGLTTGLAQTIAAQSRGNPGLAVTWIRSWVADGSLVSTPEGFSLGPGVDPSRAPTLDDARRARVRTALGSLPEPGRLALALGALLGTDVEARDWLPLLRHHGLGTRDSPLRTLSRLELAEPTAAGWRIHDPAVRLALIDELDRHGQREAFHAAAAAVLAGGPASPDRTEQRARHLLASGDLAAALDAFDLALDGHRRARNWAEMRAICELLSRHPRAGEIDAKRKLDLLYFETLSRSNLESSRSACEPARRLLTLVDQLPEDQRHKHYRLAVQVFSLASLHDEARAVLARTDAEHETMKRARAMMLLDEGHFDEAIALYREVWDESPGWAAIANGLGSAYAMLGEVDEAERWFTRCTALTEKSPFVPLCNIALVRLLNGRIDGVLEPAREAERCALDETVSQRGFVAMIASVMGAAGRDRSMVERTRQRALFYAARTPLDDPSHTLKAVAIAREHALPEHHAYLDQLADRIRAQQT